MKHDTWIIPFTVLTLSLSACQGRTRQAMVVDNSGTTNAQPPPPGAGATGPTGGLNPDNGAVLPPGTDAVTAAASNAAGKTFVNTWTGAADELPPGSAWNVKSVSDSAAGSTAATTATPTVPTTTTTPTGTTTGTANSVSYDSRVASILNSQCVSCHSPNGTQSTTPMDTYDAAKSLGAGIVSRSASGMPPGGSVSAADQQTLQAWQSAGFPKAATAGATTTGGAATGSPLTLEIGDQKFGNYLNNSPVTGRVGQTLHIVNKRTSGSFTMHTNGAPFGHGDTDGGPRTIGPGESTDIQLASPYEGEGDVYEHTDGSVNTDRLIKIKVTQ